MATRASRKTTAGRRQDRRRWGVAAVVAVVLAAGVIGYFAYRASANLPGTQFPDQGNRHVASVAEPHVPYNSEPPTSGPHLPYIAPWGVHTRPIPPELQVHNLEDGGVLVQYNCDCPDIVDRLRGIVQKYDKYVILAPHPAMQSRIAVTAWTRLLTLNEVDDKQITRFIDAYRGIDHHK